MRGPAVYNSGVENVPIFVQDTSGSAKTDLDHTSAIDIKYRRQGDAIWTTIKVTGTIGIATDSGFVHDEDGVYQLGLPAATKTSGNWVLVKWSGVGLQTDQLLLPIHRLDHQSDTVDLGKWRGAVPANLANTDKVPASVGHVQTDAISADAIAPDAGAEIAALVETYIVNEGDATAVMQAIATVIADDWVASDSSPLAIAVAVRNNLAVELARVDENVSAAKTLAVSALQAIQAEIEEDGDSLLATLRDTLTHADHGNAALRVQLDSKATTTQLNSAELNIRGEADEDLSTLSGQIDLLSGSAGPGGISWKVVVNDTSGKPLGDVACWVTTDTAGENVIAGTLYTDDFGQVEFTLDAGTYHLWRNSAKHRFSNPQTMVVS